MQSGTSPVLFALHHVTDVLVYAETANGLCHTKEKHEHSEDSQNALDVIVLLGDIDALR